MDIHLSSIKASLAARHLAMAAACEIDCKSNDAWLKLAVEELTETANALGYVLVRTRKIEARPETEAA